MKRLAEGITVLVPCYNHVTSIRDALSSIAMQMCDVPITVKVFDDCSEDGSWELLQELQKSSSIDMQIFRTPQNLGSGLASFRHHNLVVSTEFWCILDGDDYWSTHEKLQQQVEALSLTGNRVGCGAYTLVKYADGRPQEVIHPNFSEFNLTDYALFGRQFSFYVHPSSILWRNIFGGKRSPFPRRFQRLPGDPSLMLSMLSKGGSFVCLEKVLSVYRSTGLGRWSALSRDDQLAFWSKYETSLRKIPPIRYRALETVHGLGRPKLVNVYTRSLCMPSAHNW